MFRENCISPHLPLLLIKCISQNHSIAKECNFSFSTILRLKLPVSTIVKKHGWSDESLGFGMKKSGYSWDLDVIHFECSFSFAAVIPEDLDLMWWDFFFASNKKVQMWVVQVNMSVTMFKYLMVDLNSYPVLCQNQGENVQNTGSNFRCKIQWNHIFFEPHFDLI